MLNTHLERKMSFSVQPEVPQLFDYLNGFYLDCYECHSNRPGCGAKVDWILMRWKRCVAPGGSKCVKIIERSPDGSYRSILLFH